MDSRLKRHCILASMGVILLVALLVLYANQEQPRQGGQTAVQPTATPRAQAQEITYDEYGQRIGNDLSAFLQDATFLIRRKIPGWSRSWKSRTGCLWWSLPWSGICGCRW